MPSLEQSLRDAIRESGLSTSELAKRARVAKSRISTFLNDDKKTISLRTAEAIGKVIGWPRDPRFPILVSGPRSWSICRLERRTKDAGAVMQVKYLGYETSDRLQLRYWVVEPICKAEHPDYALARLDESVPTAIEKFVVPKSERPT